MPMQGMTEPQLWLVGCYKDEKGIGRTTITSILGYLSACQQPVHIRLALVSDLNTSPSGAPLSQDLSLDLMTLKCSPGKHHA